MTFKRKNLAADTHGTAALGAEELDGDESEGSDLLVADSDDEMGDSVDIEGGDLGDENVGGIHNPRQLLAAAAGPEAAARARKNGKVPLKGAQLVKRRAKKNWPPKQKKPERRSSHACACVASPAARTIHAR